LRSERYGHGVTDDPTELDEIKKAVSNMGMIEESWICKKPFSGESAVHNNMY